METPQRLVAAAAIALLAACASQAPRDDAPRADLTTASALPAAADKPSADPRMDWWRDARFGLFLHWGLYSIPAGEWNGRTDHAEWIRTTAQIPLAEYDQLVGRFNPVKFDARAWVAAAKSAGMRYIVITSKHHDGFCLFDSKQTDFDVMSTPFSRDVLKELAAACREAGLRMCFYHSIMDWHHPDYLPRRDWEKDRPTDGADFARFVKYLRAEVTELLTNYGDVGVLWFDGEWESTWNHEEGKALYDLCRALQPNVIVNNRVDVGRGGMAGMTTDRKYAGDFGTPEQEIPETGLPEVDWETCMTMNDHWGYNRADDRWKSTQDLVRKLADIASKGGNFLLNIGPTAEGELPAPSLERLAAIGAWMRVNGESIHGTSASPFQHLVWGRCTSRALGASSTLYLHVFDWPRDGRLVVPGLGNRPISARLLASPELPLAASRDASDVVIQLPAEAPDPIDSVVRLEIAGAPIVYDPPTIEASAPIFVRELEVRVATRSPDLEVRATTDGSAPSASSPVARSPLKLTRDATVKARAFHEGRPVSPVVEATFRRVAPRPGQALAGQALAGLECVTLEGDFTRIPDFATAAGAASSAAATVALPPGRKRERVAMRLTGFLRVPADDVYELALVSDDGSRLTLDGEVLIDLDGLHPTAEKRGLAPLAAGLHPIVVDYFNRTGSAELALRWAPAGKPLSPVPASALFHRTTP